MNKPDRNIELNPKQTLVVVIDPQKGFVDDDGSFARTFGADQLIKIQEAVEKTGEFIAELPDGVRVVFIRSEYQKNQFTDEGPLTELCVPGANNDCDWSERIRPPANTRIITKETNDACESEEAINTIRSSINEGIRYIIFAGCTTTTCVQQTVLSSLEKFPELQRIIVPLDTIGGRLSKYGTPSEESPYAEDDSPISNAVVNMWDANACMVNSVDEIEFSK